MEDKKPLDVEEHAVQMLDVWSAIAWSKLGLTPDILSGTVSPDMGQAKLAIDLVAALVETIQSRLDDEDRRRAQGMVRDLKINYVQKSREGL